MAEVVPPGYEMFREARRRAWDKWGHDGEGKLLGLLVAGKLIAYLADDSGNVKPVPKDYWASKDGRRLCMARNNEIDAMRGLPLFLAEDIQREMPDWFERQAKNDADRRARKLANDALRGPKGHEISDKIQTTDRKDRGGRPFKHDWDAIWVEMCAYIDREGPPDTYAALVRYVENWLGETAPTTSAIQARAKALIDRIRKDQGLTKITSNN
jgi:hypothetical protein